MWRSGGRGGSGSTGATGPCSLGCFDTGRLRRTDPRVWRSVGVPCRNRTRRDLTLVGLALTNSCSTGALTQRTDPAVCRAHSPAVFVSGDHAMRMVGAAEAVSTAPEPPPYGTFGDAATPRPAMPDAWLKWDSSGAGRPLLPTKSMSAIVPRPGTRAGCGGEGRGPVRSRSAVRARAPSAWGTPSPRCTPVARCHLIESARPASCGDTRLDAAIRPTACSRVLRGASGLHATKGPSRHHAMSEGPFVEYGVVLHRSLSNPSAPLRSLITRSQRKTHSPTARPEQPSRRDQRGPIATQALKSQTRLSYPQRQKLIDAYASGMPVKQIAERFGVHRTTITKIVTSAGVKVRSKPLASSTRDEARHLYDGGRSLAQVAEQLGVSPSAVRSAVLLTGGSMRPAGGSKPGHRSA